MSETEGMIVRGSDGERARSSDMTIPLPAGPGLTEPDGPPMLGLAPVGRAPPETPGAPVPPGVHGPPRPGSSSPRLLRPFVISVTLFVLLAGVVFRRLLLISAAH